MNQEDTLILALCRHDQKRTAYLLQGEAVHWPSFFKIIKHHKIEPIVLKRLQEYPLPGPVRKTVKFMYKQILISIMEDHTILKKEWQRINDLFTRDRIECLLLKGLSVDPDFTRMIGDLDILIRKKDLFKASTILTRRGYINITGIIHPFLEKPEKAHTFASIQWNNEFQFYNKENGLIIEIHTNLFQNKRVFVEDLTRFLDNIDLFWMEKCYSKENGGYVLSKENLLLLFCLHTAVKRTPGKNTFLLRNVVDIHHLIKDHPRWDSVTGKADFLGITTYVLFSLFLARKLLESPVPEGVLRELQQKCSRTECFLIRLHLRCATGLTRSSLFYSFIYRFLSSFVFSSNLFHLFKWGFFMPVFVPPRHKLANDFKLKRNSPLIIFAYIIQPFRHLYSALYYLLGKKNKRYHTRYHRWKE